MMWIKVEVKVQTGQCYDVDAYVILNDRRGGNENIVVKESTYVQVCKKYLPQNEKEIRKIQIKKIQIQIQPMVKRVQAIKSAKGTLVRIR